MALTMLLLTLMVLLTLSFGWRVRERIESQVMADAAAYNQAVAAARTFNEVALMNRAVIALTVAGLGEEALMNWSAHYRANLTGLISAMWMIEGEYAAACDPLFNPCPCFQIAPVLSAISGLEQEQQRVEAMWDGLEQAAAQQEYGAWLAIEDIYSQAINTAFQQVLMDGTIKGQAYTGLTVQSVYPSGVNTPSAPANGDKKSIDELNNAFKVADNGDDYSDAIPVMGSRGFEFVHKRTGGYDPIQQKLTQLLQQYQPGSNANPAAGIGGTAIGTQRHAQTVPTIDLNGWAWAEDHGGELSAFWNAPVCPMGGFGGVTDTSLGAGPSGNNFHVFGPGPGGGGVDRRGDPHMLTPSGYFWPKFAEFNFHEMPNKANDFGQPTLYSMVERDYSQVKPKPWDLNFNFQFDRSQRGTQFDDNTPSGNFRSPDGADLRQQVAVGSSIVYYHRPEAWAEPPNLFNPFWRATLVSANTDLPKYLQQAGYNQHGDSITKLQQAGWRGMR
ncbi:MAG: hypothetical protein QM723_20855 [Myxococcaceae bacterium]